MSRLLDRLREQGEPPPLHSIGARQPEVASRADADSAVPTSGEPGIAVGDAVVRVRQILLREHPEVLEASERGRLVAVVRDALKRESIVVAGYTREALAEAIVHEIAGFGPLEILLADQAITDVMVNRYDEVFVERAGSLSRSEATFRDEQHLQDTVSRILAPLGRRLDTLSPYVDARLPDGARLNVVIPPLATRGWTLTIRRFRRDPYSIDDLSAMGLMSRHVAELLRAVVEARLNLLVSGAAGSGKTTLLNALCMCVPAHRERLITIEDAQELYPAGVHWVSLEARPPNLEGMGEITIRQLVRNALRMRPDRLVVGEVRDGAAADFLMAINTGHNGSMCTVHANNAADALSRMENLALAAGANQVLEAIRGQIAKALDVVVHLHRGDDGGRSISEVAVVMGVGSCGGQTASCLPDADCTVAEVAEAEICRRARSRGGDALTLGRLLRRSGGEGGR